MNTKNANPSIECTVTSCSHHCADKQYCSLSSIKVGCQGTTASTCGATECASFQLGQNGSCCQ